MKKFNIKRLIAGVCVAACMLTTVNIIPHSEVHAATNGVRQSRMVAEIEEFPDSYQDGLRAVRAAYPDATFIYYDTGLDWYIDLLSPYNEMMVGRNLIPSSSPSSWKRVDPEVYDMETDTYKEIEPNWNAASEAIISYYMDPRNFLTPTGIFQFAELTYNDSQTVAGTEVLLKNTFMSADNGAVVVDDDGNAMTYAEALVRIGKMVNVNPYMLASRIIQEQGSRGTVLCNGADNFQDGAYSGAFNYFNVSAYGSTTEAIIEHGLAYARAHGWNSRWRGLLGGSQVVSDSYVGKGLDTFYLQHFNVVANENGRVSYAPYMANLRAPESESRNFLRACETNNSNMVFIIPVYDNMPDMACPRPDGDGNGNYWLKSLSIDGTIIPEFETSTSKYTVLVGEDVGTVTIDAVSYRPNTININNQLEEESVSEYSQTVSLNFGYNEFTVAVKAENGNIKAYVLEIVRDNGEPFYSFAKLNLTHQYAHLNNQCNVDRLSKTTKLLNCYFTITGQDGNWKSATEMVATGDTLTIRDNDNNVILTRQIMLRGDLDGNGEVNKNDVALLTQDRLKINKLSQTTKNAADIDKNEMYDAQDIILLNQNVTTHTHEVTNPNLLINTTKAYKGETFDVSLTVPEGTYVLEGYLTYNNNFIKTVDVNNTGSVHFIVVNGEVLFENGKSTVSFLAEIANDSVEIDARCTYAYDCHQRKDMYMDIATAVVTPEESGLFISAINSDTLAYHKGAIVKLDVRKQGKPTIKNINILLPEGILTGHDVGSIYIEELEGDTTYSLYANKVLPGTYNLPLDITYEINGQHMHETATLYYQINNCNCADAACKKISVVQHKQTCSYCKKENVENHNFVQQNKSYICVDCGYETEFSMVMTASEFEAGKPGSVNVVLMHEEEEAAGFTPVYTWYINGVESPQKASTWSDQLKTVNEHEILCVVDLQNGVVLRETVTVQNAEQDFHMNKIRCNTFIVAMSPRKYEYRIDDGEWQASSTFKKLQPNTTYAVSRRLKDSPDEEETIYVTTTHNATYKNQDDATCTTNATEMGWCTSCNQKIVKEIPLTKLPHEFSHYDVETVATCQSGSTWVSLCDFGCGTKDVIHNTDIGAHVFVEYNYNNNATCTENGTQTAQCAYGCDAYNTIEAADTVFGHYYKDYTENAEGNRIAVCSHGCGAYNEISTSYNVIEYIDVNLGKMTSGQTGMTTVEITTKGAIFDNYLLKTSDTELTKQSARGKIDNSKIYTLSQISFVADTGYIFSDEVRLYINGELVDCPVHMENGVLYFHDVGRFKT